MPLRFTQRILDHLSHESYRPQRGSDIAKALRVDSEDRDVFMRALESMAESDLIEIDENDFVRLPVAGDEIVGTIRVTSRGFGFVQPDRAVREGDIFIPPEAVRDAVSGDRVRIKLHRRKRKVTGEREKVGRVVEVIERGQAKFTGTLVRDRGQWLVEPDGRSLREPVLVRDPHAKNAREGNKVVIELVHYPEDRYLAEGVIVEVLGEAGKPAVETQAVIVAHGLRQGFDNSVTRETQRAAAEFDAAIRALAESEADAGAIEGREDLRHLFTVTIDPPDARDFDDAITITYDEQSEEWTLGIHIADVSHFVRRDGAMDREAYERGNSTYLPRMVLPMLPEVLSNGVCSLQEQVPRFAKTVFITLDNRGRVNAQRCCSSIIESDKRLTYIEAQALIDGNEKEARRHARTDTSYTPELIDTLRRMNTLAQVLRERRKRQGMITLNLPSVELVFDEHGHVIDAVPEDTSFTHTIIEMFMVEANEAVARLFDDLGVPIIRRVHPDPAVGKFETLRMYSLIAGMHIPESPDREDLQRLLEQTRDHPAARAIHFAVLRTLTKASYSPALIGHYALGSHHYTHFTSPIRRYPDLAVHRALEAFLDHTDNGRAIPGGRKRRALGQKILDDARVLDEAQLIELGRHCSDTEIESEEAERELRDFLVMQFLEEHHLGDTFDGVVTGVTNAGVFVSLEPYLAEGLVKSDDLPSSRGYAERWRINERSGRLTAQRSGVSIGMGDVVKVQVVAIDLATRQMDLAITRMPERGKATAGSRIGAGSSSNKRSRHGQSKDDAAKVRTPKRRKGYNKGRRGGRGRGRK